MKDFIDTKNLIQKYFLHNLVDMDNEKILEKYFENRTPEIYADFTNKKQPKLNINLRFNKTLSEERKLKEKNSKPLSKNILLLYIDSVSRVVSLRQLKKTLKFFEKFMSYKGAFNEKYPDENFHSFQFFKYNSFYYYTEGNYPLLFYGQKRGKKKDKKTMIPRSIYLKENGFITGYLGDYCDKDNIRTFHNYKLEEAYDHQFILCDPNTELININTIRCLYGKKVIEHLYEYGEQFWRKYKNNRKYLSIITNDGHEGTLETLKYADDTIYNFLNNLFNDNLLKDTTVLLLSDHGSGMPSIYHFSDFYKIEEGLPMLYIIVNDQKNISYNQQYQYINENQQMLINAFDIYNTIGHLIYGDKYKNIKNKNSKKDTHKSEYGTSLFEKIKDGKKRTSKKYSKIERINNICG